MAENGVIMNERLSRRRFLLGLGGAGLAALVGEGFFWEPKRIVVTRHTLGTGEDRGLTFVQLSDLHIRGIGERELRVVAAVNGLNPDFIVFTGDSVDRPQGMKHLANFLGRLNRETPKFAVLGNREFFVGMDFRKLRDIYGQANGRLLVNETAVYNHRGTECLISGVDDLMGGTPDLDRALAGVSPRPNHLLLVHCPAYRDRVAERMEGDRYESGGKSFTLPFVLAGHTHGGQVTIFGLPPVLPQGSGGYCSGWYGTRPPRLYVSRGIGTSQLPIRLMAPPEVACFRWHLAGAGEGRG